MSLLLVRHGDAVQGGPSGDLPRYLSARGRHEVRAVGQQLRAAGLSAGAMISSPLVRAVQTAELIAVALGFDGPVSTDADLVPDADPSIFARRAPSDAGLTIVVCHEPIIRGIAALLTGQSSFASFRTGGAVLFDHGPGRRAILGRYQP